MVEAKGDTCFRWFARPWVAIPGSGPWIRCSRDMYAGSDRGGGAGRRHARSSPVIPGGTAA